MPTREYRSPALEHVGVLVVDQGGAFRRAARAVVEATPGFEFLGEAGSPRDGLAAAEELRPDLILVEIRLPGIGGIETTRRLAARHPKAVVVLLSVETPLSLPAEVGFCGASDLLRKQELRPAVLRQLWRLHRPLRP